MANPAPVISVTPLPLTRTIPSSGAYEGIEFILKNTMQDSVATWTSSVESGATSWLSASPSYPGGSDLYGTITHKLTIYCSANQQTSIRTGIITIAVHDKFGRHPSSYIIITINQEGRTIQETPNPALDVFPSSREIDANDTGTTFLVSNSQSGSGQMEWKAEIISGDNWLSILTGSYGTQPANITLGCDRNTSYSTRTATIKVTAITSGTTNSPQSVTVTQGASSSIISPKILSVSPNSNNVEYYGGGGIPFLVTITDNTLSLYSWVASVSSGYDWLSIVTGSSGTVNSTYHQGQVIASCLYNSGDVRTGTITITSSGATPESITVSVVQDAGPAPVAVKPKLSVSPTNISLPAEAGTGSIVIKNEVAETILNWKAGVPDASIYGSSWWLSVTGVTSGSINGINTSTLNFAYTKNPSKTKSRQSDILVMSDEASNGWQSIYVSQEKDYTSVVSEVPILSVSPSSYNIPSSAAGNTNFTVSNIGSGSMPWTASIINGSNWLSVSSGSSGTNTGTVIVQYTANSNSYSRTGILRVSAPNSSVAYKDINITQVGISSSGTYKLTVGVLYGQGTLKQSKSSCEAGPSATDTCEVYVPAGEVISLVATPETNWNVNSWSSSAYNISSDKKTAQMTMPPNDTTINVSFSQSNVNLTVEIGSGRGTVSIISPFGYSIPSSGGTVSLPSGNVVVQGIPGDGWSVSSWYLDGTDLSSDDSQVTFDTYGYTSRKLVVNFSEGVTCTTHQLSITIIGKGNVTPPSGAYCENYDLVLQPVPSMGYSFSGWQYDKETDITLDGINLIVPMSIDRSVTAIFEAIAGYTYTESKLFYCPSSTEKNSVVSFDLSEGDFDYNVGNLYHFMIYFYSDPNKQNLIYLASSSLSNKRWYYLNEYYNIFPKEGIGVSNSSTKIVYDPEILPFSNNENQKYNNIDNDNIEKPLLCGVKYYVDVKAYDITTLETEFIKTISLIIDHKSVNNIFWEKSSTDNWICSGKGKNDFKVSSGTDQNIYSGVSSNSFGNYKIVWQGKNSDTAGIYSSMWNSKEDILYASGQGMYNNIEINDGKNPLILTDQIGNFLITSNKYNVISLKNCPEPVAIEKEEQETATDLFSSFCYPGLSEYLDTSYESIVARIYQEDVDNSLVINENLSVPVVSKQDIRIDVNGIPGMYAVRIRNINDSAWSGWINIDNEIYYETQNDLTPDDSIYSAYKIDNNRFIVPWKIDKNNGLKRICLQVLTLYGITRTFCVEVFVNIDIPNYYFKFYYDNQFTKLFPTYNGYQVLSLKDTDGNLLSDSSIVYFEVIFDQKIYKDDTVDPPISYATGDIKYNIIQQGINDEYSKDLGYVNDSLFRGSFAINKNDGVFNKDGKAFIELVFPDDISSQSCGSDYSDLYNPIITDDKSITDKDITPEESYEKNTTSVSDQIFDINNLKQYYNYDDNNYKFGNPKYLK